MKLMQKCKLKLSLLEYIKIDSYLIGNLPTPCKSNVISNALPQLSVYFYLKIELHQANVTFIFKMIYSFNKQFPLDIRNFNHIYGKL